MKDKDLTNWEPGEFFWLNIDAISDIRENLTGNDWMFYICLLPLANPETCILWKHSKLEAHAIERIDEIAEVLGYSAMQTYRHIKKLLAEDLIKKAEIDGKRVFVINPYVCYQDGINREVYTLFNNTKWASQ